MPDSDSNLTSIFYPTSSSRVTDPDVATALYAKHYSQSPTTDVIVDFTDLILESALTKPEDVDSLIKVAQSMYHNGSLPTVYWTRERPEATFCEVFGVDFRDKICGFLSIEETSERVQFLNASFIAGRALGIASITSPDMVGAVAEGLKFPDEVIDNFTGELAEIMALGACLQLLGSATELFKRPERFSVERCVKSLEEIEVNALDKPLVDLTILHLQSTPLKDLTSSEIVQSARSVGWDRLWVNTGALTT